MTGELLVAYHGSVIVDPTCDKGIGIAWYYDDVPKMREFDAVAARLRNGERLTATVRVTGVMKRAEAHDLIPEPYWYLDLTAAQVLGERKGR